VTWNPLPAPFQGRLAVIGGQSRKVGKTALVVDLIGALSDFDWTAVKITPHVESGCPVNGPDCGCASHEHAFVIGQESSADGNTDTSRFLRAGACRAIWLRTKRGRLAAGLSALTALLEQAGHVIIESNAIVKHWRPDLYWMVVDPRQPDLKKSAEESLAWVDAFVLRSPYSATEAQGTLWRAVAEKQKFVQLPGDPLPLDMQILARQLITGFRHPS
jgi:hypothetical protein